MAIKAYESYKNVDLPWLKRVPEHWEVKRIGSLFSQRIEKVSDKVYAPLSVTKYGIVPQLSDAAKTNNGDDRKLVCVGDFVINSRSDRKGSSGLSQLEGSVAKINLVLKPRTALAGEYIHYLLKSNSFIEEYYRNGRGIVADLWTTGFSDMKTIWLPVPPKEEQEQIVRYLDWQNSRLNKLINAKKKEIALLEEQKQALISQAVTKGLDPNAPLKDSGIDWIGQIPEHWEIRRLKSMLESPLEYGANMSGIPYNSSLPRYIRITDIETSTVLKSDNRLSLPISDLTSRYLLKTGDVLFARSGATVGKTYIVSENNLPAAYAGYLIKCCTNERYLLPLFLLFYSQSHQYTLWKDAIFIQATIQNISAEKYNNLQLPVPSVTEQTYICEYVMRRSSCFDNIIKIQNQIIEKLQEYRTRLVADVVTGQIDVRHITIPNYETVTETIDQPETDEDSTICTEDQ